MSAENRQNFKLISSGILYPDSAEDVQKKAAALADTLQGVYSHFSDPDSRTIIVPHASYDFIAPLLAHAWSAAFNNFSNTHSSQEANRQGDDETAGITAAQPAKPEKIVLLLPVHEPHPEGLEGLFIPDMEELETLSSTISIHRPSIELILKEFTDLRKNPKMKPGKNSATSDPTLTSGTSSSDTSPSDTSPSDTSPSDTSPSDTYSNSAVSGSKVYRDWVFIFEEPALELNFPFIEYFFSGIPIVPIFCGSSKSKDAKTLASVISRIDSPDTIYAVSANLTGYELCEQAQKHASLAKKWLTEDELFRKKYPLLELYRKKELTICCPLALEALRRAEIGSTVYAELSEYTYYDDAYAAHFSSFISRSIP
ncbi:MAG: AmmeMemoRadiSam system protein B [Spirochaetia bacterium]|nr:AmmeMemoRadiSam system protein B [Spirochaetia bacterium]MCF7946420.1 AmmeMemoRadiSam system protein B [Spirochaetia bacterium]MCF7952528.1 AmmeMemoRadiSam system protein B [Spirochaetales bacterium]